MENIHPNTLKKVELVQKLVGENYEPGNQQKCQIQALRNVVRHVYPMSERTFRRYMSLDVEEARKKALKGQMELNF